MLNRSSNALRTWVVVGVGALVLALSAFFILSNFSPDSTYAHDPDVHGEGHQDAFHGMGATDIYHIHFHENDTDAVETFMSRDPETGAAVDWDVTGTDGDVFEINASGVLTFKNAPDYEDPKDKEHDEDNDDTITGAGEDNPEGRGNNRYNIMVRATEQQTPGDPNGRALSTEVAVVVLVENEDEDGVVELNYLQPEVDTDITAMLTDEDMVDGTITWEWSVSKVTNPNMNTEAHWTVILQTDDAVTQNVYTPRGDRDDDIAGTDRPGDPDRAIDEGEFIRAKASYMDMQGADKMAIGVSMYPVRAEVDSDSDGVENADNGSPGFPDGLDYTRDVPENTAVDMNVGNRVVAQDPNNDTLSYELVAVAAPNNMDIDFFNVDRATGQISIKKMLDYEEMDERDYDGTPPDATAGEYKVIVKATDPSGESAQVTVTITATSANDAPVIRGNEELRVMEQDSDDRDGDSQPDNTYTGLPDMNVNQLNTTGDNANVYRASDDDARGQITWSFKQSSSDPEAEDWALFERSSTDLSGADEPRAIRFKTPPDFENPQDANRDNVYKVTLVASDGRTGGTDEHRVSIFVQNQNEQGELTLMASGDDPTQPVIGEPITAMVSDPDGGVAVVTWQWYRSDTKEGTLNNGYSPIPGATYATYTPVCCSVEAVAADPNAVPPVEEVAEVIADDGKFLQAVATYLDVTSMEDDPSPSTDTIDERVQENETTALPAVTGDGTTDGGGTEGTVYRVMASTEKAVRVPDAAPGDDDTGDPTMPPVFDPGSYTGTVYENSEVGSLVTMSALVSASNSGTLNLDPADSEDNKLFMIDAQHGQIRVGEVPFPDPLPVGVQTPTADAPDMEDPMLDYETRSTYRLIVSATNEGGKATANVTISLMDRNEHPYFDKATREIDLDTTSADVFDRTIEYAEGSTSRTVTMLAAVEPDEDSLGWEVLGADSEFFEIVQAPDGADGKDRVELRWQTGSQPDFERPMDRLLDINLNGTVDDTEGDDAAGNNMYKITVRATESATVGSVPPRATEIDLTVSVTDSEEDGAVRIRWRQPEVGTPITAHLTDLDEVSAANPDGDVTTGVTYKWYRAKVNNPNRNVAPADVDDATSEWEAIDVSGAAAEDQSYTPQGKTPDDPDTPADEGAGDALDEGRHLLATASYTPTIATDPVVALGISEYRVRADVHDNANNSPDFTAAKTTRRIAENAAVGAVVTLPVQSGGPSGAVDVDRNEDGDVLTYEIVMTNTGDDGNADVGDPQATDPPPDFTFFSIDRDTGQIRIKKALNFEGHDDPDTDGVVEASEYQIVVRATDPSGEIDTTANPAVEENRDDITVVITVTDVNEAPKVIDGYSFIQVNEMNESKESTDGADYYIGLGNTRNDNNTAEDTSDDTVNDNANKQNYYQKMDQDPVDSHDWTIAGPDGRWFEYSSPADGISRRLHFIDPPDYEDPQDQNGDNVYEVIVRATDNRGLRGDRMVMVEVMNVQEDGMLVLSPAEPVEATAGEGVEIEAMLTDPDGEVVITDWKWANNPASGGMFSDATVVPGQTMYKYTATVGNFVWAMVDYRDGASVIDDPVTALDERNDDPDTADTEEHKFQNLNADGTPDGDDTTLFHNSDEMLTKVTDTAVQAPADDTMTTTPGDTTTIPSGPPSVIDLERTVPENTPSTGYVGMRLSMDEMPGPMTGPDANLFIFAEAADGGTDEAVGYYDSTLAPSTDIENDKMGQLALRVTPAGEPITNLDYEAIKNSYVIEFSDDSNPSSDVYRVTILVADVNEAPSMPAEAVGGLTITGPFNVSRYDERRTDMVATYNTTGEAPGATVTWDLSGDDANDFRISSSGELTFRSVPDFENPADMNSDNIYSITVEAMDDTTPNANVDTQFVTVTVGNVDEEGMLTVSSERPAVDRMITAMLEDDDGIVGSVTWTWSMSDMLDGTYTPISGADEAMYTVMESDVDMFLQVKAEYEDGHGRGKSEMINFRYAVTMSLVFPSDMMNIEVDENTAGGTEIGDPVVASGGQAETVMHAITGGADMAAFTIDAMSGQVSTAIATMLDYEAKDEYTFEVTATGTAADSSTETVMTTVTVMVMNVDEEGEVMLSPSAARVDMEITATLTDPDNGVTNQMWQWESSDDGTAWTPIAGATLPTYTPVMTDADKYLRAVVDYNDAEGAGKTAMMKTGNKVGEMPTTGSVLGDRYDSAAEGGNENGQVDVMEMLRAVREYFAPGSTITVGEMLELVQVYFATS